MSQVQNYSLEHALPELYLHGLAQGDFALASQRLSCQDTPLSGSTLAHMKKTWQEELAQWQCWSLEDLEAVYFWSDGLYVKAKLEKDKAALLLVLADLRNGQKVVLAVVPGQWQSMAALSAVLRDLKAHALYTPQLVIRDGHLGIWAGLWNDLLSVSVANTGRICAGRIQGSLRLPPSDYGPLLPNGSRR